MALRYACAEVRELLMQRAAARLGVSLEKVTVADGVVNGGGRSVSYWELTDEDMLKRDATAQTPRPSLRGEHKYIGVSVAAPRSAGAKDYRYSGLRSGHGVARA